MFMVDGGGKLDRVRRRPPNWQLLESRDDYRFVPENRRWDADEREWIAKSLGLYDLFGTRMRDSCNEGRLKRRAIEYCLRGAITLTADPPYFVE
jgi:hypothetical protein